MLLLYEILPRSEEVKIGSAEIGRPHLDATAQVEAAAILEASKSKVKRGCADLVPPVWVVKLEYLFFAKINHRVKMAPDCQTFLINNFSRLEAFNCAERKENASNGLVTCMILAGTPFCAK